MRVCTKTWWQWLLIVLHLLYYNPASARLTIGLLMCNVLNQLKIIHIDDGSGGSDVGM